MKNKLGKFIVHNSKTVDWMHLVRQCCQGQSGQIKGFKAYKDRLFCGFII